MRFCLVAACVLASIPAQAQTSLRLAPVNGATMAAGARFDIRVEATGRAGSEAPRGLRITLDGIDITGKNLLAPGVDGERGRGGTGTPDGYQPERDRAAAAPAHTTNFLQRDVTLTAGRHTLTATTADGATASASWDVFAWPQTGAATPRVKNVILLLGDGMGLAARTAARALARGYTNGKADGRLAMDTMDATGLVMTSALNAFITDSAPGMSSYVTGHKAANNMEGVYPDNTWPARARSERATPVEGLGLFDNPRTEYLGALLRRTRGPGFNVGIVTTADVTDATPAANAVHTSNRSAAAGIAQRFLDERATNGISVLMGGGRCHFVRKPTPDATCGRVDGRDLEAEFAQAGFRRVTTRTELMGVQRDAAPPAALLGLFRSSHLSVAFDKVGAGKYSDELSGDKAQALRDQPMLDEMTASAIRTLDAHSPQGFYLMVEGASIDKQEHAVDSERAIWDVIEFDRAVAVALEFARRANSDADPDNDTLVIATADHETGGLGLIGVGNEHYAPKSLGYAVRDYAAVFRFEPDEATLDFFPRYDRDPQGYPTEPDPAKKLLMGWAAAPDHYENWLANRRAVPPATNATRVEIEGKLVTVPTPATANPARDGLQDLSTNGGRQVAGFLVAGTIENAATGCPASECPPGTDTAADPHTISGHTASDVPLSASGPGALTFTGTYDNTDVFRKILLLAGRTPETKGSKARGRRK
jgi:alkaline phosphatase